jgi:hypothetical protein
VWLEVEGIEKFTASWDQLTAELTRNLRERSARL